MSCTPKGHPVYYTLTNIQKEPYIHSPKAHPTSYAFKLPLCKFAFCPGCTLSKFMLLPDIALSNALLGN